MIDGAALAFSISGQYNFATVNGGADVYFRKQLGLAIVLAAVLAHFVRAGARPMPRPPPCPIGSPAGHGLRAGLGHLRQCSEL